MIITIHVFQNGEEEKEGTTAAPATTADDTTAETADATDLPNGAEPVDHKTELTNRLGSLVHTLQQSVEQARTVKELLKEEGEEGRIYSLPNHN